MKVACVLFDDRFGGPQRRVIDVAQRLHRHGIETTVVLPARDGDTHGMARRAGLPTVALSFHKVPRPTRVDQVLGWGLTLPRDIWRFRTLFRAGGFDLVHVNGPVFIQPALGARLAGLPVVWHFNDTVVPRRVAPLLGRLCRALAQEMMIVVKAVGRHYGVDGADVHPVFEPVDSDRFQPRPAAAAGPDRALRVGLIANWTWIKGIEFFVRAMALVAERLDTELQVVMVGRQYDNHQAYTAQIEAEIDQLGLRAKLEYHGFTDKVETIVAGLDVFVLSSVAEACPITVLEAMACAVPVVGADVGGVREQLLFDPARPAGVVVPPRDPVAIAEAVCALAADPAEAARMGRNGRHVVEQAFTLAHQTERHRLVYERVLAGRTATA